MNALSWDHNAHYHPLLLRQLPARCDRVLDVGCGAGDLAIRLAARAEQVDALDRSALMIDAARRRTPPNVTCLQADVLDAELQIGSYDAITSLSALHHMSLPEVLPRLASWLRPGGVLAAVAVLRPDLPREIPIEAAAVIFTNARGLALAAGRARHDTPEAPDHLPHEDMPVARPPLTFREARAEVLTSLPGAQVRRLLLWRYLVTWTRPEPGIPV